MNELIDNFRIAKSEFCKNLRTGGNDIWKNVVGVGIGPKRTEQKELPILAVRVYVKQKYSPDELPRKFQIQPFINGYPTDIIQSGLFRPLPGGAPLSSVSASPGSRIAVRTSVPNVSSMQLCSLGAIVSDGKARYILGPNHAFAANGRMPQAADVILPPPGLNKQPVVLGHPLRFVPLNNQSPNVVDCALATLDDKAPVHAAVASPAGPLASGDPIDPVHGMRIAMIGASDPGAIGSIVDVDFNLTMDYAFGTFPFEGLILAGQTEATGPQARGQFMLAGIATNGDSGALLVDTASRRPVGMVFGGARGLTVACRMKNILDMLSVKLEIGDTYPALATS